MKKILLGTLAIVAMASCSKNEATEVAEAGNEIVFSNLNDRVTRAANDAGSDYKIYADYGGVWYIDDVITGSGDSEDSAQNGPHYWIGTDSDITFYAYAPAVSDNISTTPTPDDFTIDYVVPSSADEDFTIAASVTQDAGIVYLKFAHILSKVTITPQLSDALISAGYTISAGEGGITCDLDVATKSCSYDILTGEFTAVDDEGDSYGGDTTYMIMRQPSPGLKLQINNVVISKNGVVVFEGNLAEYTIQEGDITEDTIGEGKSYTIAMTITSLSDDDEGNDIFGGEIIFSSSYEIWDDDSDV